MEPGREGSGVRIKPSAVVRHVCKRCECWGGGERVAAGYGGSLPDRLVARRENDLVYERKRFLDAGDSGEERQLVHQGDGAAEQRAFLARREVGSLRVKRKREVGNLCDEFSGSEGEVAGVQWRGRAATVESRREGVVLFVGKRKSDVGAGEGRNEF